MDAATGLMYVGNGQYYDPATGRFLTRDALPGSTNPYAPWGVNPLGLLLGAGIVVGLYRRKHGKFSKYGNLALFFVFILTTNMILTACCPTPQEPSSEPTPPVEPAPTPTPTLPPTQPPTNPPVTPPAETPPPPATCPSCARFDKVIFICGVGDGTACANGDAPLNPFRRWAERNGYKDVDFRIHDVDVCGGDRAKLTCANDAKSDIDNSSNERFLLIGHSAGADAVIVTSDRVSDKSRIAGIVLLDPTLTATLENDNPGQTFTDLHTMADSLPKPVFLGVTPVEAQINIAGAFREQFSYPGSNNEHEELALDDQVVSKMCCFS